MSVNDLLRSLPSVDEALKGPEAARWLAGYPRRLVVDAVRGCIDGLRRDVIEGREHSVPGDFMGRYAPAIEEALKRSASFSLMPLINATGIVMHTNLGRSPLSKRALENIKAVAGGYSTLEYELERGRRGKRYSHIQPLLRAVTGAEDGIAVNNNASAVLLCLSAIARGKEVIVSRGELVEIGGSFRVPEVMEQSGAILREVGATNKTHPRDYERAINENTALILKVHQSNYRIVGFTADVGLRELKEIGQRHGLPVMYDMGSGCLTDLKPYGINDEPTVAEVLAEGPDVVTFSGDKLLGGPQAGLIVGSRDIIARLQGHPLLRAIRIDKLTLAALEATLFEYHDPASAIKNIPTLRMLAEGVDEVRARARRIARMINRTHPGAAIVQDDVTYSGGGALPARELDTAVVALKCGKSPNELEAALRLGGTPAVIGRIKDDTFVLDARTIAAEEIKPLVARVLEALVPTV